MPSNSFTTYYLLVVEEALPVVIEEPSVIENGAFYSEDDVDSLDAYDFTKK